MSNSEKIQLDPSMVSDLLAYLNQRPYGEVRLFVGAIVGAVHERDQAASAAVVRNAEARGESRAVSRMRAAVTDESEAEDVEE